MNVIYKIFKNLVTKYPEIYADEMLDDYECGFRKGHFTTDHIFTLQQTVEKA
jgi:hypothetical protein